MRSMVDVFASIRRDARVEGLSVRELARRHGVHRRTVRAALASADPPPRKIQVRVSPRLAPFKEAIDQTFRVDLDAPRKQLERHPLAICDADLVQVVPCAASAAQRLVRIESCGLNHDELDGTRKIIGGHRTDTLGWRAEPVADRLSGIHREASRCG